MAGGFWQKVKDFFSAACDSGVPPIDDPVAQQTGWTPVKPGGANFRTRKLVMINANRIEFPATAGAVFLYLLFALVGVAVVIGFAWSKLTGGDLSLDFETLFVPLLAMVFTTVGLVMFIYGTSPIVFDMRTGYFWKGRKDPAEVPNPDTLKVCVPLEDIYALQILREYCRSDKSSFYSYELNIVRRDGERVNVIDHGNLGRLLEDARALAELLDVPVWDAT